MKYNARWKTKRGTIGVGGGVRCFDHFLISRDSDALLFQEVMNLQAQIVHESGRHRVLLTMVGV